MASATWGCGLDLFSGEILSKGMIENAGAHVRRAVDRERSAQSARSTARRREGNFLLMSRNASSQLDIKISSQLPWSESANAVTNI